MKIWTMANQNGGLGETTSAVALRGLWCQWGMRNLSIDIGPPASLSSCFRYDPDVTSTIKDVYCAADTREQQPNQSRRAASSKSHESERYQGEGPVTPLRPKWAEAPFQSLLVKLSGLTWGAPPRSLVHILKGTNKLTGLVGQPPWQPNISSRLAPGCCARDACCLDRSASTVEACIRKWIESSAWGMRGA